VYDRELTTIKNRLKTELAENKTDDLNYIFHYTSAEGLLNIIANKTLWFSDISFLNDFSEKSFIYKRILDNYESFKQFYNKHFLQILKKIFENYIMKETFMYKNKVLPIVNYYIACFSKKEDCLELWNYYTKSNNSIGYNIKFNKSILSSTLTSENNLYSIRGNVIYDNDKQLTLIKRILEDYNDFYVKYIEDNKNNQKLVRVLLKNVIESCELFNLFFKDLAFLNECEYRIVLFSNDKSKFRIYNGLLIPYNEIQFDEHSILGIKISPNNNNLYEKGVKRFLGSTLHDNNINVNSSKITKRY
jgi:hypothetical protein